MEKLALDYRPIDALIPYARNSRTHSEAQVAQIAASIREFGWTNPVLIDGENGIIAGHGRVLAARKLGLSELPVIELRHMSEAQRRAYIIADNKLAEAAGWDDELLRLELGELKEMGFDLELVGFDALELGDMFGEPANDAAVGDAHGTLAERFMVAPFSVLDARRGWWQDRKRAWMSIGLRSEEGREELLTFSQSSQPPSVYAAKNRHEAKIGREVTWDEFYAANPDEKTQTGTSIFDPVLCELAYRWFSPAGGVILDPFSGGSVRGIVAVKTGRQYFGCDLRPEQVEANRKQWETMSLPTCTKSQTSDPAPVWHCGDSRQLDQHCAGVAADLVFSCPPYADLEVYSDRPDDLSNMSYPQFVEAYREIIAKAVSLLKPDRFACFVVGEVRGKDGIYRNFVGDTIAAFEDAGARYYNEAVLITATGSLAIRAGKQFSTSRKLGKTHQNVLVFVKGDPRKATDACGAVEVDDSLFEAEAVE